MTPCGFCFLREKTTGRLPLELSESCPARGSASLARVSGADRIPAMQLCFHLPGTVSPGCLIYMLHGHVPLQMAAAILSDTADFRLARSRECSEIRDALVSIYGISVRICMFNQKRTVHITLYCLISDNTDPVGELFLCIRICYMIVLTGFQIPCIKLSVII